MRSVACDTSAMPKVVYDKYNGNRTEQLRYLCEISYIQAVLTYGRRESCTISDVDVFKFLGR